MATRTRRGADLLPPDYKTVACLEESLTASSYWAQRTDDGQHVVVKIPGPELAENSSFAYQLERAALELIRVKHPHILHVLDAGRTEGVPYVVVEHVDGESLAQRLAGPKARQTPTQIYAWLLDVAEALDFIHAKKVVHGDVRPASIYEAEKDMWRIADFAFSTAIAHLAPEERAAAMPRTEGFAPPELLAGKMPEPAGDQYSLAACVYLAVVGEHPPADEGEREAALSKRLSREATEDVLRALSPDPASRFASCYEFARAFGLERKRVRRTNGAAPEAREAPFPEATNGRKQGAPALESLPALPAEVVEVAPAPRAEAPLTPGRVWRIRMGSGDRYARLGREGGFIAAGWEELGDLEELTAGDDAHGLSDLVERYERTYGLAGAAARVGAGQVWRFLVEMEPGDLVLLPNLTEAVLHVGRVEGNYTWEAMASDGCRLPRRRAVTWLRDVALEDVPNAVARALEGPEPLTNLDGHWQRAADLAAGRASTGLGGTKESALLARAVEKLYAMPLEEFPRVLREFFSALRYDAEVLPGRSDETWEALGRISAQGLADVVLRVVAHRSRRELDVDAVFALRGALATDEQGAILTLGRFTPAARNEASARGKKRIRLIDGPTLASLALERWEHLPPKVRDALAIRRVERTTVEHYFEPTSD